MARTKNSNNKKKKQQYTVQYGRYVLSIVRHFRLNEKQKQGRGANSMRKTFFPQYNILCITGKDSKQNQYYVELYYFGSQFTAFRTYYQSLTLEQKEVFQPTKQDLNRKFHRDERYTSQIPIMAAQVRQQAKKMYERKTHQANQIKIKQQNKQKQKQKDIQSNLIKPQPQKPRKPHQRGKNLKKTNKQLTGVKRKHRFKPGTVALRQITKYRKNTDLLIRKIPFQRVIRQILHQYKQRNSELRIQASALQCLQQASESYLVGFFQDANLAALHARRVTLMARDFALVKRIRNTKFID